MFKYNSLSDLKDGTLTTPLRKEGDFIVCQNENGIIVNKLISDFDFAKKPEEREFILGSDLTSKMEEDLKVQEEVQEEDLEVQEEVQEEMKLDKRLPANISGKNIKVSIETQRIP